MLPDPAPIELAAEPIDVVYTWVDDRQPGYREVLSRYAKTKPDDDPARTRDNLDILRYSMRSLHRHAPWVNRVFLLTCRPQVPTWLVASHPRLTVVHHDELMNSDLLPTFNSFAIISHLHRIPGLSQRFIYLEDDMLFLAPTGIEDFVGADGLTWVFRDRHRAPRLDEIANPEKESGWNLALAHSNSLLDQRYGAKPRQQVNHVPLFIDKTRWEQTLNMFPEQLELTRRSRFRSAGNFAPEYLYPQCLLADGRGQLASDTQIRSTVGYVPLEDFWPVTFWHLWQVHRHRPKWVTLNDNFGARPSTITERLMRQRLQSWLPDPGPFERA